MARKAEEILQQMLGAQQFQLAMMVAKDEEKAERIAELEAQLKPKRKLRAVEQPQEKTG